MADEPPAEPITDMLQRRPKSDLTGKQRKHLRGLAHHLSPLVRIGHGGLTDGVADAILEALEAHELIKIKLLETAPMERAEFADAVGRRCGAHIAGTVGRTVILYRRHKSKPTITLPARPR